MKNKAAYILGVIAIAIGLTGCPDTADIDKTAAYMTIQEVSVADGFYWFNIEYNMYTPDPQIVQQIAQAFDPAKHRTFFFIKPACTCAEPNKPFARIIKALREAGIADTYSEIYSMAALDYSYPYEANFNISALPSYFVMNIADTIPVYSIADTLEYYKLFKPEIYDTIKVERLLLEGLR